MTALETLTARIEGVEKGVSERIDTVESKVAETTENIEEFGKELIRLKRQPLSVSLAILARSLRRRSKRPNLYGEVGSSP